MRPSKALSSLLPPPCLLRLPAAFPPSCHFERLPCLRFRIDAPIPQLRSECVDRVRERCLPSGLNYPMLEEYDFRNDTANPDVTHLDLKPTVRHRPYQVSLAFTISPSHSTSAA